MPKKCVGIVNVYGKMWHDMRLTNNGRGTGGPVDRAKEPRQNTHNREQDGKGKTCHEVTMEKGPKRKHDKKTKSSSNCDPPPSRVPPITNLSVKNLRPRTLHHHHNWQVLHSHADSVDGRRRQGTGQNSTGKRSC